MNDGPGPPSTNDSSGADALETRLAQAIDRLAAGDGPESALDAACADAPELRETLRRRLSLLAEMGVLGDESSAENPSRVGRFRVLQKLGGGGMGVVHLAFDEELQRTVALKLIRPEQLWFDGARQRFQREVDIVARLAHPGVVPVYSVGEEAGLPWFAMELVRGCSLADALTDLAGRDRATLRGADLEAVVMARAARIDAAQGGDSKPSPKSDGGWLYTGSWEQTCLRIVARVAETLEHAHQRGVLHRDLKPSNIMLTAGGGGASRALLVDFGLATSGDASEITTTGARLGSLPYMAPEQTRGETDSLDARCDVYGLGVTLFELLTLEPPFRAPSDPALLADIQSGRHRPPREIAPELSWEAETVCLTAMEPDAPRRYGSADELAADLEAVLAHRPIAARRAGPWRATRRWIQRHPTAAVAVLLGGLLLVGGPSLFAWQQHKSNTELAAKNDTIAADAKLIGEKNETLSEQADRLTEQTEELNRRNARIETQRDELARSNALLLARGEEVERHFALALDAVDSMLTQVSETSLAAVPQMTPVRQSLLASAISFYEQLLNEGHAEPELRQHIAQTLQLAGEQQYESGDVAAAVANHQRSVDILRELVLEDPSNGSLLNDLALGLRKLSVQHYAQQQIEDAVALSREAAETQRRGLTLEVDPDGSRTGQLVITLTNLGAMCTTAERDDEALQAYTESAELARGLVERFPEGRRHLTVLARALAGLGNTAENAGRVDAAVDGYEQALRVYEQSLVAFPGRPDLREEMCDVMSHLAEVLAFDPPRSLAMFERTYSALESLTRDFPEAANPQATLARLCSRRAEALVANSQLSAADRSWQESRLRGQVLVQYFDELPIMRAGLAFSECSYAAWLLTQDRAELALEVAASAEALFRGLLAEGSDNIEHEDGLNAARDLVAHAEAMVLAE